MDTGASAQSYAHRHALTRKCTHKVCIVNYVMYAHIYGEISGLMYRETPAVYTEF